MAQALYSKYRPNVFDDVVGQKHILQTLKNAISSDKITHAYMFCGPRGTGKTTMARLLAKACMCQNTADGKSPSVSFCGKCNDCTDIAKGSHVDVYELDAASRTGVENVREEIINRVGFAPTRGSKKIYIIDEVHMLSTAAFNALLKTLEEPPEHVIFILCTTDPQKVPETILSRCQRFDFSSISATDILERLKYVCEHEKVKADDDALRNIAQNAQGAMRNALTSLEQMIAYSSGELTSQSLDESYASDSDADFDALIESLGMRDLPSVFEWIQNEANNGVDFNKVTLKLIALVRDMYVSCAGGKLDKPLPDYIENHINLYNAERLHRTLIVLSELQTQMKTSTNLRLSFEVAMAKIANAKSDYSLEGLAERISNLEIVAAEGDLSRTLSETPSEPVVESEKPPVNVEEKPKKVVNVIKDEKKVESVDKENTVPDLKIPERPQATNFSEERKNLKEEANVVTPAEAEAKNLNSNTELTKLWHAAFSNIRKKYPAFGATLITATPSYNDLTKQFILTFPASASFNVGVLKKPESMEKIHDEIKAVMGLDVGFNIEIDENSNDGFNPTFENNFREKSDNLEDADEDPFPSESSSDYSDSENNDSIKNILNNYGAYNITEE